MASKKKAVKKIARRGASPLGGRSAKKSAVKKSVRKPATKKPALLRIGDRSPTEAGLFMGIAVGENPKNNYYVYRGRYAEKAMNHADALKFAADCRDGGHKDWELIDRTTGALLYANSRKDMRSGWHWLKETYAGSDAYAWCQSFSYGRQDYYLKVNEFEVVLVRRVPIQ